MKMLFAYNWQVREEWFTWAEALPEIELSRPRIGGQQSISANLYHVVEVEEYWLSVMQGTPLERAEFAGESLPQIRKFSDLVKPQTQIFLEGLIPEQKTQTVSRLRNGALETYTTAEVLAHMAAHEIHHMGQLSVWSRELGLAPPSANLIRRGLA